MQSFPIPSSLFPAGLLPAGCCTELLPCVVLGPSTGESKMSRRVMKEMRDTLKFVCSVQFWRMAVLWTLSLLISYFQLLFTRKSRCYPPPPLSPPPSNNTRPLCIITGATSGLGKAAASALSKRGFYIILVGRSSRLLSETIQEIKKQHEDAHLKDFQVDISSFQSILKFKDSLQKWLLDSEMHVSVQLLINNAGILAMSPRLTAEGYDQMMGTNYIGAFFFTKLLLPLLSNSRIPSRVINVTSFTHRNVYDIQINKETVTGLCFLRSKDYPCSRIYEFSKFCLLLLTYELHRQLGLMSKYQAVSVIAVDPGTVKTNIMREVPSVLSCAAFVVLKFLGLLQSPEDGVSSIVDAALAPPEVSGLYFFGGKGRTIDSSALSYDAKLAEKLWTTSCDLFILASRETSGTESNCTLLE